MTLIAALIGMGLMLGGQQGFKSEFNLQEECLPVNCKPDKTGLLNKVYWDVYLIVSEYVIERIGIDPLPKVQMLDRVLLRGKTEEIGVVSVLWGKEKI